GGGARAVRCGRRRVELGGPPPRHPPAGRGRGVGPPPLRVASTRAAVRARLRSDVLRPYRAGRRGLRLRFPAGRYRHSGTGDSLTGSTAACSFAPLSLPPIDRAHRPPPPPPA